MSGDQNKRLMNEKQEHADKHDRSTPTELGGRVTGKRQTCDTNGQAKLITQSPSQFDQTHEAECLYEQFLLEFGFHKTPPYPFMRSRAGMLTYIKP